MFLFLLFSESLERKRRGDKHYRQNHDRAGEYQHEPEPEFPPDQLIESCIGPNTIKLQTGKCVCKNGFPFGNPNNESGCWNCEEDCHDDAKCVFPGKCQCRNGYSGDGTESCKPIIPKIVGLSPSYGLSGTKINISYIYEDKNTPKVAYCKFGSIPIDATVITPDYIQCESPKRKSEVVPISISFNADIWSTEEFFFKYTEKVDPIRLFPFIFGSLLIIGIIVYTLFKLQGESNKKKFDDDRVSFLGPRKKNKGPSPYEQFNRRGKMLV